MKDMLTSIQEGFGRLGISEVQIGSTVIRTKRPNELDKLEGCGDTIRRGDIISFLDGPRKTYPAFVVAIFTPDPEQPEVGPVLLTRRVDDGPLQKIYTSETSFVAWGPVGRRSFKRLNQDNLNRWFAETKAPKPDGWHGHPDYLANIEFRTLAGVPVEVKCGNTTFKHAAEEVGRITGYDLKLSGRFSDKAIRLMSVTKATRRKPPQVPGLFIVRLFDMMDGWLDISEPLPQAEAQAFWNEKTENGTKNTKFEDGDYWKVFPADTRMVMTPEFLGR